MRGKCRRVAKIVEKMKCPENRKAAGYSGKEIKNGEENKLMEETPFTCLNAKKRR